jgi:uncharacterized membrane protein
MLQKISRIYPWQIELIPVFLLFLVLYLISANYPGLPDQIPTHFNIQGTADKWGDKSEILSYGISALFVYVLITLITVLFILTKDPKRFINLPSKIKDRLTPEQAEKLRAVLVRCLLVLKILIMGQMAYLLYNTIDLALRKRTASEDSGILFFTAAILIVVGYMVYKSLRLSLGR